MINIINFYSLFSKKYKIYFLYILSGIISLIFEFVFFNLFITYFNYKFSNILSIILGIAINYLLSITLVFKKNHNVNKFELIKFILVSFVSIWINQIAFIYYFEKIHINIQYSKLLSIFTSTIFNYISKKYLVFNKT